ncbi:LPXTG cell wall anchor domain-containing protein [Spirillospora sp. CA-253888]
MRVIRRPQARVAAAFMVAATTTTIAPAAAAAAVPADGAPTAPRLKVSKHASKRTPLPGDRIVYNIAVRNTGDVPAYGVRLQDRLPDELSDVRVNAPGCRVSGPKVTCRWSNVRYRATRNVAVSATLSDRARPGARLTNTAILSYAGRKARALSTVVVARPKPAEPQESSLGRPKRPSVTADSVASLPRKKHTVQKPHTPRRAKVKKKKPAAVRSAQPLRLEPQAPAPCPPGTVRSSGQGSGPGSGQGQQACTCPPGMVRSSAQGPGQGQGVCSCPAGSAARGNDERQASSGSSRCARAEAGGLPNTGAPVGWLVLAGLGTLAAGAAALVGTRVRRPRARS